MFVHLELTQESGGCDSVCTWGLEQLWGNGSKDPSGRQSEDTSKHLEFKAESLLGSWVYRACSLAMFINTSYLSE